MCACDKKSCKLAEDFLKSLMNDKMRFFTIVIYIIQVVIQSWIPFKQKQKKHVTLVRGTVACLAHNLNWELDAEQVFLAVVFQFPLHNQLYLEMQKRRCKRRSLWLFRLKKTETKKTCEERLLILYLHQLQTMLYLIYLLYTSLNTGLPKSHVVLTEGYSAFTGRLFT